MMKRKESLGLTAGRALGPQWKQFLWLYSLTKRFTKTPLLAFVATAWSLSSEVSTPSSLSLSPEVPASTPLSSESTTTAIPLTPAASISFWRSFQLRLLGGHSELPTSRITPLLLYFCDCFSADIKTNSLFSFEEDHALHFGIDALAQLLLKFFPSVTDVGHLNGAPQDHGHKARLRVDQGALVDRRGP